MPNIVFNWLITSYWLWWTVWSRAIHHWSHQKRREPRPRNVSKLKKTIIYLCFCSFLSLIFSFSFFFFILASIRTNALSTTQIGDIMGRPFDFFVFYFINVFCFFFGPCDHRHQITIVNLTWVDDSWSLKCCVRNIRVRHGFVIPSWHVIFAVEVVAKSVPMICIET